MQLADPLEAADPRAASPTAWIDAVYDEHADVVFRFVLSQTRGKGDVADEVTSEVFLRALRFLASGGRPPVEPRPWLLRIARNVLADGWRRRTRQTRIEATVAARQPEDVETLVEDRDTAARIAATMAQLPAKLRLLLGLRLAADLTHAEIAAVVDMSEGVVRVALHRGLAKLRARLEAADVRP